MKDPRVYVGAGVLLLVFWLSLLPQDRTGAGRCLRAAGYSDVIFTHARPFGRSRDDFYSTGFEATSPSGEHVTGYVTRGIFGGSAIHLD
jgi:hypothetical protein